jgi:tetratricopeptide (TPR) repeat protein
VSTAEAVTAAGPVTTAERSAGRSGGAGIYAVGGMAGVGKTTLAVHVAHRLAPRFPDGQVFLPLHGHTAGQAPVTPEDALASLLRIAGISAANLPAGLAQRAALWRDWLAGRRLLLVLDDAVSSDQIRPLLPGTPGSLVLITSRRRLTALEDSVAISLTTLPGREAAELLIRLADRRGLTVSSPGVAQIAAVCGYLPLAIGLLARRLHRNLAWTPAGLAADLTGARDQLARMAGENVTVAAAFDLSYRDLTPDQQEMFLRLGEHPGTDIDVLAAAALAGTTAAVARRRLEALYDQHLIGEPVQGRYRFHDLIRQYARALAAASPAADRDRALDRLLDFYLRAAQAADARLRPEPRGASASRSGPGHNGPSRAAGPRRTAADTPRLPSRADAIAWLAAERPNLRAAATRAADTGRHFYACALPAAEHGYLTAQGHWAEDLALQEQAVGAARRGRDRRAQARALTDLGDVQRLMADLPAAAASQQQALALYRAAGDPAGTAGALMQIGWIQYLTDDLAAAAASLGEALAGYRLLGDQSGEARVLTHLGFVQYISADLTAAAVSLTRALELHRRLGDQAGQADALHYLGVERFQTGRYGAATDMLRRALELRQAVGDRNGEAATLIMLGHAQRLAGELAAAAASLAEALDLHLALGNELGEAGARNNLGLLQRLAGDLAGATASQRRALELYQRRGSRLGVANAHQELGLVQQAAGDFAAAAASEDAALRLYREVGDRGSVAETWNNLGDLALARSDPAAARHPHEQALAIAEEVGLPLEEARACEGLGRAQLPGPAGQTLLRRALDIYERLGSPGAGRVKSLLADIAQQAPDAAR